MMGSLWMRLYALPECSCCRWFVGSFVVAPKEEEEEERKKERKKRETTNRKRGSEKNSLINFQLKHNTVSVVLHGKLMTERSNSES